MTRKEKAEAIGLILDGLYPVPAIPLDHRDAYTFLVAVVLSAQCTDKRVNLVTPHLFNVADTPEKMAELEVDKIASIIRPCGLSPQKSKAIRNLSELLVTRHGGRVPDNFKDLEALPGVGHKTASVVMNQIFGQPAFPVDTHIHRLAWRWKLSNGKSVEQTEKDLKKVFPESTWGARHLQMIYFGREHCPARGHDPLTCPVCRVYGRKRMT